MTFASVVEQRGHEKVTVVEAHADQSADNVESVTAVGHRHGLEQGHTRIGEEAANERCFLRIHPRPHVSDELPDPMHRSGPG